MSTQLVSIPADGVQMEGRLELPTDATGIVIFSHGGGSTRHSPRNNFVAKILHTHGVGTLLLDLLTLVENLDYQTRFDTHLLTQRLLMATRWVRQHTPASRPLPMGYFGSSTGAAAALQAAAVLGEDIHAVVSRGGRPDLAGTHDLTLVHCPTLLLVGEHDEEVRALNHVAYTRLSCTKELSIIPGATHLFEEAGALDEVARQSAHWFGQHLRP